MRLGSFPKKAAAGYGVTAALSAIVVLVAALAFNELHDAAEAITHDSAQDVLEVGRLQDAAERANSSSRGFLMTKGAAHWSELEQAQAELHESLGRLETMVEDAEGQELLRVIRGHELAHRLSLDPLLALRHDTADVEQLGRLYEDRVTPKRRMLDEAIDALMERQQRRFIEAAQSYTRAAQRTMPTIGALGAVCLFAILVVAFFFTRMLTREYEVERVAREAREEILALVSHDLKNPLGAILMSAALLEREAPADEVDSKTRHRAALIRRMANRMSVLLNDLLDAASMDAGRFKIEAHAWPVGLLVTEAIEAIAPLAAAKSLCVEREIEAPDTLVYADRARILQVFGNLLGNAVKFTPAGGRIVIRAAPVDEKPAPRVRFAVSDTGPGIPTEQRAYLFQRFFRRAKSEGGGTGLGLYSVKGIVEAHGGTVWIDPDVPHGTTVCFTVPRAEPIT